MPRQQAQVWRAFRLSLFLCFVVGFALMGSSCENVQPNPTRKDIPLALVNTYKYLAALNPTTGKELWRRPGQGTYNQPLIANGVIYVASGPYDAGEPGTLEALREEDGKVLWSIPTRTTVITSMALDAGVLYVSDNLREGEDYPTPQPPTPAGDDFYQRKGTVSALRASDGKQLWRVQVDGEPSHPTVVNGIVYVATARLLALSAKDGHELWRFEVPGSLILDREPPDPDGFDTIDASADFPVVHGRIYLEIQAPNSDGRHWELDVLVLDAKTGQQVWRYNTNALTSKMVVSDDAVYVTGDVIGNGWPGFVTALRASDGKVLWNYHWTAQIQLFQPVIADGTVYLPETLLTTPQPPGDLMALRATDGSLLRHYAPSSPYAVPLYTKPAVSNSLLYTILLGSWGQEQYLVALDVASGKEAWRSGSVGKQSTPIAPQVSKGVVYVAPFDGSNVTLSAFRASDGKPLWTFAAESNIYTLTLHT